MSFFFFFGFLFLSLFLFLFFFFFLGSLHTRYLERNTCRICFECMHASIFTLIGSFPWMNLGKLIIMSLDVICEALCELSVSCNYVLSFHYICMPLIHAERMMGICELCAPEAWWMLSPRWACMFILDELCMMMLDNSCMHTQLVFMIQNYFRDLWLEWLASWGIRGSWSVLTILAVSHGKRVPTSYNPLAAWDKGGVAPPMRGTIMGLGGTQCHKHTMKRVGCDPHVMTSKVASLKRRPSGHMRANIEECHDAIEKDDASSNTPPRRVGIEDKLRHKQDRDIE